MLNNLLSRKFIFAILATILGFYLVISKMVTPDIFFEFVKWLGGMYILGNVATKVASK